MQRRQPRQPLSISGIKYFPNTELPITYFYTDQVTAEEAGRLRCRKIAA